VGSGLTGGFATTKSGQWMIPQGREESEAMAIELPKGSRRRRTLHARPHLTAKVVPVMSKECLMPVANP
jgi:hypothetical protein